MSQKQSTKLGTPAWPLVVKIMSHKLTSTGFSCPHAHCSAYCNLASSWVFFLLGPAYFLVLSALSSSEFHLPPVLFSYVPSYSWSNLSYLLLSPTFFTILSYLLHCLLGPTLFLSYFLFHYISLFAFLLSTSYPIFSVSSPTSLIIFCSYLLHDPTCLTFFSILPSSWSCLFPALPFAQLFAPLALTDPLCLEIISPYFTWQTPLHSSNHSSVTSLRPIFSPASTVPLLPHAIVYFFS